jgi:flagellar basal-body rod protein FlgC
MSSVLSIATSGMAAAQRRLEVSAHNIANASADLPKGAPPEVAAAFAALRVDQVEISGGGTAPIVRQAPLGEGIDFANEAVQLMVARHTFAASAKMAQMAGDMQKTMLDMKV